MVFSFQQPRNQLDTKADLKTIALKRIWASCGHPPLCDCLPALFFKEVILNLMVWGPLQENNFPMLARIWLPVFLSDLFAKLFAYIFPSVVSGKNFPQYREPLKQSQDSELDFSQ